MNEVLNKFINKNGGFFFFAQTNLNKLLRALLQEVLDLVFMAFR